MPGDRREGREELRAFLDRHVQDIGDRLALVVDFQRFAVVPGAVAHLAGHVDVRQEVHFDLQRAVAGAGLAAAALDVEGEPARQVAADLRLGGFGEELADVVKDTRVGGRVGPRGPADRALVDVDHLVEVLEALDRLVPPRHLLGAVELVGQDLVEDLVDQGGLAGAADAGHRGEQAQREGGIHVQEVVLLGADDLELALLVVLAALLGDLDLSSGRRGSRR